MGYIKKNSGLLFVFFISLVPLLNLLTPGLPITHDSLEHTARIASFYQSVSEGNIIPRWAGNLNWGYGHPILMFLYPLPSYMASFFHFLDFSYVDSVKILFSISFSLSGIFMFLWLKQFLNQNTAVLGSILYLFAPYRFIDLYVRGALGEHVAFVFIPLLLIALFYLNNLSVKARLRNYYFGFILIAFSFAGLILSHNAISLLFFPFLLFYVFYLFYIEKSKIKFSLSFFSLLVGLLLSFFFWFPAFMEGKYTLRDIVTAGVYSERFVNFKDLIYSNWGFGGTGEFSVQIGFVHIILIVLSIFLFFKIFKKNDNLKILFLGTLLFLFVSIFLMLGYSDIIWRNLTTLQKLQFPWRFLSITVFCTSLIGAIFIYKLNLKNKNILIIVLIITTILLTANFWYAKEFKKYEDKYFETIFDSTTDTGESSPIWSVRFMESRPKSNIEVIEGKATIVELPRNSTYHEYVIDTQEKTRIRENTLYFPGWKVYDNYKIVENVEFQDPKNRGVITFYLDRGMHSIILKFEDTKLRRVSNYVSLFSIFIIFTVPLIFLLNPKLKTKKYKW